MSDNIYAIPVSLSGFVQDFLIVGIAANKSAIAASKTAYTGRSTINHRNKARIENIPQK